MKKDKVYLLEDLHDEIQRLEFQDQVWADETKTLWEKAQFSHCDHILDLGCGPGFASMELARSIKAGGKVTALDSTLEYLEFLKQKIQKENISNLHTLHSPIENAPFENEQFDGVFARMVLLFIKDLEQALEKIFQSMRPGGRLAISDFHSYRSSFIMSPHSPKLEKILDIQHNFFLRHSCDLEIARKLPELLMDLGFDIMSLDPIQKIGKPQNQYWTWVEIFLHKFIPQLIEEKEITKTLADEFWLEWNTRKKDPKTFFTTPTFLNIVAKKP
ncbi:MAG: methyltransferase domain-containing protein [Bdellovibrionales bacterium]|nr:methyltransferase domain-containing protein [Bdellovibrionales bacterium]